MRATVSRPLFHGISPMDAEFPPSILSLGSKNTVATGSFSKAYSLAGIRVGWLESRNSDMIQQCTSAGHYTTISVTQLDQQVAAFALSPETLHSLLGRNIQLAKVNLELLERFAIKHDEYCSWTKPFAGTTAFVKFERDGKPIDDKAFCEALQANRGVMFLPGDVDFGEEFRGYVNIGYVNHTEIVEELSNLMRKEYDDLPLSE